MSGVYVYLHEDPETKDVFYIGIGTGQRAWMCSNSGGDAPNYGARSRPHYNHLCGLMAKGFLPCDWVRIALRGLTRIEACRIENQLIRRFPTPFNRPMGLRLVKMTPAVMTKAVDMRRQNNSYKAISEELGVSVMTVYRALTGKTKNVKGHEQLSTV